MMQNNYQELPLYRPGMSNSPNDLTGNPSLYIYPAEKPLGKAIIMCPGGGLTQVVVGPEGHDMAPWFNQQGVTFAILKYRLPHGNRKSLFEDIHQALLLMRDLSNDYGFKELGVMGASIGGYIAASAAVFEEKPVQPDFQILFYPVISMRKEYTHLPSRTHILGEFPSTNEEEDFSPELHVGPDTPKAFITAASDDKAVSPVNSTLYYDALIGQGVSASLHLYPEGGHSFAFRDTFPYKTLLTEELKAWLEQSDK